MNVCADLCRIEGVGEDGTDRSLSWRQTGIFSGMLVFLCHLRGSWNGWMVWDIRAVTDTQTCTHTQVNTQTHKGPNDSKVLGYYPQTLAIRKGQSLFLPPSLSTILSASLLPQHDKWLGHSYTHTNTHTPSSLPHLLCYTGQSQQRHVLEFDTITYVTRQRRRTQKPAPTHMLVRFWVFFTALLLSCWSHCMDPDPLANVTALGRLSHEHEMPIVGSYSDNTTAAIILNMLYG